ncbi:MAG TPA: nuclear transport factor 2 family protein [Candidatus Limnocylindria bacterium]
MSNTRTLAFIAGGIIALVLVSVVVVLLAGGRQRQEFAAGSPEAALQAYLDAWKEGDAEATWALFSAEVRAENTFESYERAVSDYLLYQYPESGPSRSVFIDGVDGSGERVTVQLTVEEYYGDGLNTNSYRSPRAVRMVREGGAWKLADPLIWLDPMEFPEPKS